MTDKKIMNIIYISLIIPIILLITIFLFFFFSVNKVYAATTINISDIRIGRFGQPNTQINNYTWTNYPAQYNYINGYFTNFSGTFTAHMKVEMQFTNDYMETGYKSLEIHAFINNQEVGGVNGNCPVNGSSAYCDIYFSGTTNSTSDVVILQLVTTGIYFQTRSTQIRVSGSATYDESSSNLNNGSFNAGVNSINNNISGSSNTIINNQNQNTQDIINNQNSNSQAQIEAIEKQNLKCTTYNYTNEPIGITGGYLKSNGQIETSGASNWRTSTYINIKEGNTYILYKNQGGGNYCLYGEDKSLISCNEIGTGNNNITPLTNGYIRYSFILINGRTTTFTGEYCYNMLDKQNQTSENIENALNDSSVSDPSSSLNGLNANIGTNSVISDLLLLPVTLYQSVLNNINGTCSAFTLGTMFNHTLRMPCLNISGVIGSSIYGIIDVLISGFFILSIRKKFVDIFNHFTSLKVGGNELE